MGCVVSARPRTWGPIRTPNSRRSTTSETSLRGTRPASRGARTLHSTIQKSDEVVAFMGPPSRPVPDDYGTARRPSVRATETVHPRLSGAYHRGVLSREKPDGL